MLLPLEI
jgi:hypothetical protein